MAQIPSSSTISGYEHSESFDSGLLSVGSIHQIYYEQYGLKNGLPVISLHGGPGGLGAVQSNTKFFNPSVYRVVLFDQCGSGKSLPRNELKENTVHHLVSDIEALRMHLSIPIWHMVFGGSWGTALGLLYTETHPERVHSLVLRGVYTVRLTELAHSRRANTGAARFYPDMYDKFIGFLPESKRSDPIKGYYELLTSSDPEIVAAAAREWNRWDLTIVSLRRGPETYAKLEDPDWCLTHALLEAHYYHHAAWLEEGQLLASENLEKIKHIHGVIVQGRYDLITPPWTAWQLHKAWPNSSLHWVDAAGHGAGEPGMTAQLTQVCDDLVNL